MVCWVTFGLFSMGYFGVTNWKVQIWSLVLLRMARRGSLTRRCGRGESAIKGHAAGFRVGHREGHWTRHRGWRRQQEGAGHFALATPVRLQTTHTG